MEDIRCDTWPPMRFEKCGSEILTIKICHCPLELKIGGGNNLPSPQSVAEPELEKCGVQGWVYQIFYQNDYAL